MATHATILTLAVWWQSQQGGESHSVNSYGLVFPSGCDRTRQYRTWRQASSAPLVATFGMGYSPPFFSSLSPWPSLLSGVTGHRSQPSFLEPERYALCADVFLCVCGRVRGKRGGGVMVEGASTRVMPVPLRRQLHTTQVIATVFSSYCLFAWFY